MNAAQPDPPSVAVKRTSRFACLSFLFSLGIPFGFILLALILVVSGGGLIGVGFLLVVFIPFTLALIFFSALAAGMGSAAKARIEKRPDLKGVTWAIMARSTGSIVAICAALAIGIFTGLPWLFLANESYQWRKMADSVRGTADAFVHEADKLAVESSQWRQQVQAMNRDPSTAQAAANLPTPASSEKLDSDVQLLVKESQSWRQTVTSTQGMNLYLWMKDSIQRSFHSLASDFGFHSKKPTTP